MSIRHLNGTQAEFKERLPGRSFLANSLRMNTQFSRRVVMQLGSSVDA